MGGSDWVGAKDHFHAPHHVPRQQTIRFAGMLVRFDPRRCNPSPVSATITEPSSTERPSRSSASIISTGNRTEIPISEPATKPRARRVIPERLDSCAGDLFCSNCTGGMAFLEGVTADHRRAALWPDRCLHRCRCLRALPSLLPSRLPSPCTSSRTTERAGPASRRRRARR